MSNPFSSKKALNKHIVYCKEHGSVRITMPNEENKNVSFKNRYKQELVPFVVYADFECNNEPIDISQPNPERSYTKLYQKHVPSGFCYHIQCLYEEAYKSKTVSYTGKDAALEFEP